MKPLLFPIPLSHAVFGCLALLPAISLWAAQPSTNGLKLWLDASDPTTLVCDSNGRLLVWRDKSGSHHDATNSAPNSHPRIIPGAMAGRNVLRFGGKQDFLEVAGEIRRQAGPLTVFIVSQRSEEQVIRQSWQRLLSSTDGAQAADNHAPNLCLIVPQNGSTNAYAARIDDREFPDVMIKNLVIGRTAGKPIQFFSGDIAELLLYDRTFLSEDESRAVLNYLHDKWKARISREDNGWTRIGALPNPPQRTSDAYPLSDQENKGNWVRVEELSDEFEGTRLDPAKWRPEYPTWKGRQPARFSPHNVTVNNGKLHLVMRKDGIPKELQAPGYTNYTSAIVDSMHRGHYGYYEVMARPMNSAGSSSFWFSRTDLPHRSTEIDVFEIGGNAPGFERKYNMNLHVWETPQEKRHWNIGGAWLAPFRFAEAYHVYGFEWDEKEMKYYVDGVIVRRVANTHWHDPLHMQFDSETMPTWFGMPKDQDLPSTYSIEYVRAWRKAP